MVRINNPQKIENKSFALIDNLLKDMRLSSPKKAIIKRVIHASADASYAKGLIFHPLAIPAGLKAIREGKNIVVDVNMLKAGINKKILSRFKGKLICPIDKKDIIERAGKLKLTRAILVMRTSVSAMNRGIVAIGNAPTALFELCDLVEKNKARPALVIGVPVGFVGAKEAKKKLRSLKVPYIANRSRKGGSAVAAAIVNALLKMAEGG